MQCALTEKKYALADRKIKQATKHIFSKRAFTQDATLRKAKVSKILGQMGPGQIGLR